MATKYFVVGAANVRLYDGSDVLVGTSKALMDTSVEVTTQNTDVRGGKGNALQYSFYHGTEFNVTLTDTTFNLDFLSKAVGETIATGANVYTQENVTLGGGGAGTVTGTPLTIQGTSKYGWIKHSGVDTEERVTFTGSNFTSSVGAEDDVVCVRYFATDAAAKKLTIYGQVIPSIVRAEMDVDLATSSTGSNIVGKVQVLVPQLQLSGGFTLNMTADGVSSTPITGRALANDPDTGSCSDRDVLAYITRVLTAANWWDTCTGLAILNGDIALTHPETAQLALRAVHSDGGTSIPPMADLTFATSDETKATVSVGGLVTSVAPGTTYISATITSKTAIDASVLVTVSAP